MRSMTFLVNDRSSGGRTPAVAVTITENSDGSLSFDLNVIGPYTGDLRGFFFDIADESHIGKLNVTPTSLGFTEFQQANDSIKDLGSGANMQGLLGSDGGYDAGIEIGIAGTGKDDYQSFSFKLTSAGGPLTLEDFSNVDFGLRLTSVGWDGFGGRDGEVKLLEHTSSAIDARDDASAVTEDLAPNTVNGNVFDNDANLKPAHFVTALNGSAWNVGQAIEGTYGSLRLHLNGSYTYTLDNTKPAVQALALGQEVTETFGYTAKTFDELTSFSTDSALLKITVTGANDAPQIVAGTKSSEVFEDGSRSASGQHVALDVDQGAELTWSIDNQPCLPISDRQLQHHTQRAGVLQRQLRRQRSAALAARTPRRAGTERSVSAKPAGQLHAEWQLPGVGGARDSRRIALGRGRGHRQPEPALRHLGAAAFQQLGQPGEPGARPEDRRQLHGRRPF
jgi:VCBS repeat-containing protein